MGRDFAKQRGCRRCCRNCCCTSCSNPRELWEKIKSACCPCGHRTVVRENWKRDTACQHSLAWAVETSRLDEETKDLSRRISTHIERELETNQTTEEIVVRVIRCNNLCPTDTSGQVKSSDPYVQLAVGPTSRKRRWRNKTPVKRQTLNPVWTVDNTFSFHVPMRNNKIEDDDKILKLQVFDADLVGTDDFVGEV